MAGTALVMANTSFSSKGPSLGRWWDCNSSKKIVRLCFTDYVVSGHWLLRHHKDYQKNLIILLVDLGLWTLTLCGANN